MTERKNYNFSEEIAERAEEFFSLRSDDESSKKQLTEARKKLTEVLYDYVKVMLTTYDIEPDKVHQMYLIQRILHYFDCGRGNDTVFLELGLESDPSLISSPFEDAKAIVLSWIKSYKQVSPFPGTVKDMVLEEMSNFGHYDLTNPEEAVEELEAHLYSTIAPKSFTLLQKLEKLVAKRRGMVWDYMRTVEPNIDLWVLLYIVGEKKFEETLILMAGKYGFPALSKLQNARLQKQVREMRQINPKIDCEEMARQLESKAHIIRPLAGKKLTLPTKISQDMQLMNRFISGYTRVAVYRALHKRPR